MQLIRLISNRKQYGLFKCICSREVIVYVYNVFSGHTRSCGCLIHSSTSREPEYKAYHNMKTRCYNSKTPYYHLYGGRGIRVCSRWLRSFDNFIKDMGKRPPGMTLDRVDNSRNYSAKNCRWVSYRDQNNNKRNNNLVSYRGNKVTIQELSAILEIKPNTLLYRKRRGWSDKDLIISSERTGKMKRRK